MIMEQIAEQLQDAELVLVGLGEDLDTVKYLKASPEYQALVERTANKEMVPWLDQYFLNKNGLDHIEPLNRLAEILDGKNYFIISLCQDGLLEKAELKKNRIVQPCGNYEKLQCIDGCNAQLYNVPEDVVKQIEQYVAGKCVETEIALPVCPHCGKTLVFNNKDAERYVEEGYLKQWELYKKWLQGTVNKKVCIMELGAGMKYPSVLRWPFEKITFFNQKAVLFRVHGRLYQITEEIKDKAYGIHEEPDVFLKELSKVFECDKLNSSVE